MNPGIKKKKTEIGHSSTKKKVFETNLRLINFKWTTVNGRVERIEI